MEREAVLWRIGYAGCSEGPYRLSEVFERLKERRWSGEVLVYARGRTEGWVPMDSLPEFAPLVAELRKTYMGQTGMLQWKASEDRYDRGVDHEVWTEEQSQLSLVSQADTWVKGGIELQEQSFGFLESPAPPVAPAQDPGHEAFLPSQPKITPAPTPQMQPIAPKRKAGFVPEGTSIPGFHAGFQVQVPQAAKPKDKSISSFTMEPSPPPGSPVTRIVTAPPSTPGIVVLEDGHSAFLPADSLPATPPTSNTRVTATDSPLHTDPIQRRVPPASALQSSNVISSTSAKVSRIESRTHAAMDETKDQASPSGSIQPESYATRYVDAPPSIPGIDVSEDGFDAFLN